MSRMRTLPGRCFSIAAIEPQEPELLFSKPVSCSHGDSRKVFCSEETFQFRNDIQLRGICGEQCHVRANCRWQGPVPCVPSAHMLDHRLLLQLSLPHVSFGSRRMVRGVKRGRDDIIVVHHVLRVLRCFWIAAPPGFCFLQQRLSYALRGLMHFVRCVKHNGVRRPRRRLRYNFIVLLVLT